VAPLRIGLRVLSNPAWMGGVNYVRTWVRALHELPEAERPVVYLLHWDEAGLAIAQEQRGLVAGLAPFSEAGTLDLDIVYPVTQIFEAPFDAPWAAWIPDWQCKHLPQMFDALELARRDLHYRFLATRAPFLVLSSQMAYDDTIRIVGKQVVPMAKLHFPALVEMRNQHSIEKELERTLTRLAVPRRFFLVCNQFWKHKNHLVVLRALVKLGDPSIAVVFTGDTSDHRSPDYFRSVQTFIEQHGLGASVYSLDRIARDDQLQLMRAAVAVIQPSQFEGWSAVVEEARALKRPLLLSRIPVHIEQAPPDAWFFDVEDAGTLATLLRDVWDQPASAGGPTDYKADAAAYSRYVLACARQFLDVTRNTSARYDPRIHDTHSLLVDLLRDIVQPEVPTYRRGRSLRRRLAGGPVICGISEAQAALRDRVFAGVRMMLLAHPSQVSRFTTTVAEQAPEMFELAEREILMPVRRKLPRYASA